MENESEKNIEKLLVKKIKSNKGICIKLEDFTMSGLPDRLCLLPGGVIFFVETKSTGKKPSKIQKYMHEKIKSLGFSVLIIDSTSQILQLFK